jgi:hypothetical protein
MPKVHLHRGFARALLGKPGHEGPKPVDKIIGDVKSVMQDGYR